MVGDSNALIMLMRDIVAGDAAAVSRSLAASPALARPIKWAVSAEFESMSGATSYYLRTRAESGLHATKSIIPSPESK